MSRKELARLFDADYFAHGCGEPYERNDDWLNLFNLFAGRIIEGIAPKTVLDAGCAMGFLVEKLREKGVEAYGVDLSDYAIGNVHPDVRDYCWVGSITEPLPQRYDLIVSIEVLEHLPARDAEAAVANLCRHSDDILFSSSPFDYKEPTHFNVRAPEAWAELFARQGFYRDVDFDASFITPWAVRFRRRQEPVPRLVREYERRFWRLWKENTDLRELNTALQLADRHGSDGVWETLQAREKTIRHLEKKVETLHRENVRRQEKLEAQAAYIDRIHQGKIWRLMERLQRLKARLVRSE